MADKAVQVYPVLPASTTGDLWHLAAAAILNTGEFKDSKNPKGLRVIPVVYIETDALTLESINKAADADRKAELIKQNVNGPVTYNFLKDLGLDCLAIAVKSPDGEKAKNVEISGFLWSQDDGFFDQLFAKQRGNADYFKMGFMETVLDPANQLKFVRSNNLPGVPVPGKRSLHYHAGTTAALMNLAEPGIRPKRLDFLYNRLNIVKSGATKREPGELSNANIDQQAREKMDELMAIVKEKRKPGQKIIIYNNRGNTVNSQTNSSAAIFDEFRKKVALFNLFIVVIDTGGPTLDDVVIFDLFNKSKKDKNDPFKQANPGIDPLVTCRFFHLVAQNKSEIFGMFSGRSGSCDVAAFNGVNCYYWDTPYLELATYDADVCRSFGFDAVELKQYETEQFQVDYEGANEENRKRAEWEKQKNDIILKARETGTNPVIPKFQFDTKAWKKARLDQLEGALPTLKGPKLVAWDKLRKDARNQLAQSYRTLQQFLIMSVGYPANGVNVEPGLAPWAAMRIDFEVWLKGKTFLDGPMVPVCPKVPPEVMKPQEVIDRNLVIVQSWLYWKQEAKQGLPPWEATDTPDQLAPQCEAEGKDKSWSIRLDALRAIGYRFG